MNKTIRANIIRFIGLILLQGLLLNQLNFLGYLNPMVYIVWVMMFPFKKNKTPILILSFLLGLCIDFFFRFRWYTRRRNPFYSLF